MKNLTSNSCLTSASERSQPVCYFPPWPEQAYLSLPGALRRWTSAELFQSNALFELLPLQCQESHFNLVWVVWFRSSGLQLLFICQHGEHLGLRQCHFGVIAHGMNPISLWSCAAVDILSCEIFRLDMIKRT